MNWIGFFTLVGREVQRFLRVPIQTLLSPWITAALYIFIFGRILGGKIQEIHSVPYIQFIFPGILMLNVITSSFIHTSSSLYFQRFLRHIEEILVAPLSYFEMIVAYVISGVIRGCVVGGGVYGIAILFQAAGVDHVFLFALYTIAVCIIFSLIGLLIGLWAENFEQLAILNTFFIMPLVFLGGVFNSLSMLPQSIRTFTEWNPFFYFVDGLRFSMTGFHEGNLVAGGLLMLFLIFFFGLLVWYLFQRGWKLRL